MSDILVLNNIYQGTAQACIVDFTPPTFAGINAAAIQSRGQIRASWLAATESTSLPVTYEVYVQASTAVGLFSLANRVGITDALQFDTWTLRDGSFLVNGTTYFVGVRAVDAVGNRDANLVSTSLISTGVFTSADVYLAQGAFTTGAGNTFQGTMWILKNSILGTGATLGTASYQVYDKTGNPVSGMSESGIAADANGQFKITPVANLLADALEHYMVKITIVMDTAPRTGYVPLVEPPPQYDVEGAFGLSSANELQASFWVSGNEKIISGSRLGTASYQVYDKAGTAVPGMSQSGITADSNGIYEIAPVASTLATDLTFYVVKVSITVDNTLRSDIMPIQGKIPAYECYATVSVNALNQFQMTMWVEADGKTRKGSGLGTASYAVYDSAGAPVSGLSQSGVTADANGRFIATPVSAALLADLTHYTVTMKVIVDGVERESMMGFARLGT